jgi:hypothetical protein
VSAASRQPPRKRTNAGKKGLKITERGQPICVYAIFAVFIAMFRELIDVEDNHTKFDFAAVLFEVLAVFAFWAIAFFWKRNRF